MCSSRSYKWSAGIFLWRGNSLSQNQAKFYALRPNNQVFSSSVRRNPQWASWKEPRMFSMPKPQVEHCRGTVVLPSGEAHKLKKPFPSCKYLRWALAILEAEMKFNKYYGVPLKAKATRCPRPLSYKNAELQRHYRETPSSKAGQTLIWINLATNTWIQST